MAKVNTSDQTIRAANGIDFPYELERKRKWNIGLRKHSNSLTGRIVVFAPNGRATGCYRIVKDWSEACAYVELCAPRWQRD